MQLGPGREPVVHRHDHDRGPAAGGGLVVGAGDRAGHVLRAHRLVDPYRVVAREPVQAPGQERLEREVAAVLLADEHDQRRAVLARGGERGDGVAEPRCRVQQRQRRHSAGDRVAGGHRDRRALVERQDELQILREPGEKRHLGRARVGEDRRQLEAPQHIERRGAHGVLGSHAGTILQNVWPFVIPYPPRNGDGTRTAGRPGSALLDRCQRADRRAAAGLARAAAAQDRRADRDRAGARRRVRRQPADDARGAAAAVGRAPDPRRSRPRRRHLRCAHAERGHEPQPVGVDRADALGADELDERAARRAALARGPDRGPRGGQRRRRGRGPARAGDRRRRGPPARQRGMEHRGRPLPRDARRGVRQPAAARADGLDPRGSAAVADRHHLAARRPRGDPRPAPRDPPRRAPPQRLAAEKAMAAHIEYLVQILDEGE